MLPAASVNDAGWPWTEESPQLADVMPNGQSWPKISIVTPVLNGEAFIEQTIRSVLLQGYPNYEFLILDGGSTDGTLGIIENTLRGYSASQRKTTVNLLRSIEASGWLTAN